MTNWKEIHPDFTPELQREWEDRSFDFKKTREWIDIGLTPKDTGFAQWLSNKENKDILVSFYVENVKKSKTFQLTKSQFQALINTENINKIKKIMSEGIRNAREWLQQNYPDKENTYKIYLNQQLEGVLDCSEYKNLWYIFISTSVEWKKGSDSNKFKIIKGSCNINNKTKTEIIPCVPAQDYLDKYYPKNGTCVRRKKKWNSDELENHEDFGKTREEVKELYIYGEGLEGNLDLSDFKNLEKLYCQYNCLTNLNLNNCPRLERIYYYGTEIEEQLNQHYWVDIHEDFKDFIEYDGKILKKVWTEQGFTKEQTKQWIKAGAKPDGVEFILWYLNTKKLNLEWALENEEEFKHWRDEYKNFGTCEECQRPNTSTNWCQSCNAKHFARGFDKWTSGNEKIDQFILDCQLEATSTWNVLEWIPYEQFSNIEYIAQGGFGKVEKAEWKHGEIWRWDNENKKWRRSFPKWYRKVILKTLFDSNSLDKGFLPELMLYKMFRSEVSNMVPCYGISRDGKGNYIMVMKFMEHGNLREYLKKNYREFKLYDRSYNYSIINRDHSITYTVYWKKSKLHLLQQIIQGLKDIHRKNLVHRDFHSGNIIVNEQGECHITDLGLSKPIDKEEKEGEIYGVMPYVAPEVLRGQPYTQKSDIYSLGMIMYEILTGLPPFYELSHDSLPELKICQGVRPQFPSQVKYPQELIDLIERCWNNEPEQRPTAREVDQIVNDWFDERDNLKKNTPFTQQIQEAEEHNQSLPENIRFPKYEIHPQVSYYSKPINTKQITELLKTVEYSQSTQINFLNLKLEECNTEVSSQENNQKDTVLEVEDPQEQSSTQVQIQIPPK